MTDLKKKVKFWSRKKRECALCHQEALTHTGEKKLHVCVHGKTWWGKAFESQERD